MSPAEKTLLFDLDGTLVDSRPGIIDCLRHAFIAVGTPSPSHDMLAASIGRPLRQVFAELIGTTDDEVVTTAVSIYRERYGQQGLYDAAVYGGVPDMLAEMCTMPAYVATSKAGVYAARVVHHFGLAQHFRGVHGADLDGRFDRKSHLIEHIMKTERIVGPAIMIGDRAEDVAAAKANGIFSIGVLWGYGSERELAASGADLLCAAVADLPHCVQALSG